MGRTNRKLIKLSRSKQLHERASFCKRLALGAADPKFAAKLQALADEYEGEAAAETQMEAPATRATRMARTLRSFHWLMAFPGKLSTPPFFEEITDSRHLALFDHTQPVTAWQHNTSPAGVGIHTEAHRFSGANRSAASHLVQPGRALGTSSDSSPHLYQRDGNGEGAPRALCRRVAGLQGWSLPLERVSRKCRDDSKTSGSVRPLPHPGDRCHSQ